MTRQLPFIAYPSIGNHAVTGDRRTALLVAADGTIDWMCVPDYDGESIFGALIDANRGGYWSIGLPVPATGEQGYLSDGPAIVTSWSNGEWRLEVTDLMPWPERHRPERDRDRRIILRRIRCTLGETKCAMQLRPRANFDRPAEIEPVEGGLSIRSGKYAFGLWSTFPMRSDGDRVIADLTLRKNDEHWAVLSLDEQPGDWSKPLAERAFNDTLQYWRNWLATLTYKGRHAISLEQTAMVVHLLGYAPNGSVVAAPTTSLPERIGGDRNYDYRFAWIRDASLSITGLSLLGDTKTATLYLDWLAQLGSKSNMPIQVAYHISGAERLRQHERVDLAGYRGSRPVLMGNHAYSQIQLGALGYLADCAEIHVEQGGEWKKQHWEMIERAADYICENWREPDSGIWELSQREHFVASKVMAWVVLDRALTIAERTGAGAQERLDVWRRNRREIHAEVLIRGWSDQQQCFVQRYGHEALDAAALLIPVMDFLPADHPRVQSTIDRLVESLGVDGFIYRFQPLETPGTENMPMEQFEGAFLPCNFWLATAYAKSNRIEDAEHMIKRAEVLANASGLFAEEVDPRSGEMLGNYPLLFSQVEYARALLALAEARQRLHPHSHPL